MTRPQPYSSPPPRLVSDLHESELLDLIFPLLPTTSATVVGPGDDAAVVSSPDGRFVVSTDVLVENRHFRRAWSGGYDVGWRAAMQNLADIAAMGARPTSLVVALVVPGDLPVDWVLDFSRGLAGACSGAGAGVVGGDLSGGDLITVAVTVHGDLDGHGPVLRSGARAGDVLAHAGVRGRSAAGMALLDAGLGELDQGLVDAFLRPESPLELGVVARRAGATAMLDVSDGLLLDAGRIARASGVRLDLADPGQVFADELARLEPAAEATGGNARTWVLTGGEDHGLLATFPPSSRLPDGFRVIGSVGQGPAVVECAGPAPAAPGGWDHFAERT